MSTTMDEEIKRWTARRKSKRVLEIVQGKTTVAEASRQFDMPPSYASSTRDNSKSCRKPMEKPCWRYAPEKIGIPVGQVRDLMVTIQ